jgi:hypothetical protein
VIEVLHLGYSVGWILTGVGVFVAGQRLRDHRQPSRQTVLWSFAAGAIWPVLLVAAVQMGVTILLSRMLRDEPEHHTTSFRELETLTKA